MTLATTHLHPIVAASLAAVVLLLMGWYWPKLSSPETPVLRRRIRRLSMLIGFFGIIAAAMGFGLIDPDARPMPYFAAWGAAALAIFGVVMLAVVDALVSIRIHRAAMRQARRESAESLGRAITEAKARRAREGP